VRSVDVLSFAAASAILPFSANQRGLSGKPNRAMI
jgi:hypothetical protein